MTLRYYGPLPAAPANPKENDAYLDTSVTPAVYKYYDGSAWQTYAPVKVVDDLALSKVYEGNGTPSATSNAVQFPDTLDTGTFYLDGSTGDVWAYVTGTTGWQKW